MSLCRSQLFRFSLLCLMVISATSAALLFMNGRGVHAQTADELQGKIDARNKDIANLEKEIKSYQTQITALGSQANSLAATVKSLQLTQKKLAADIEVTQNKIDTKNLEIDQLALQIRGKESNISDDARIVSQSFQIMNETGNSSLLDFILGTRNLSQTINHLSDLANVEGALVGHIGSLKQDKTALQANKDATETARAELQSLRQQLTDQKQVVINTTAEQNTLLKQTKQSETSYKNLLAQRQALQQQFQQEIDSYESQLKLIVDASKIPHTGSGVLSYPLDSVYITQYFGNTPFATANPQIYNGKGHTGVDFRASIGTPVKAALGGIVVGVANTDIYPRCYSYGRWIMIKHDNGLSSLYAHLSVWSVAVGQQVSTGQVIGYSGNTGYSTGPHLHFGVYATQGVQIKKFDNSINCKGATIPIADIKAYLNPLSFL